MKLFFKKNKKRLHTKKKLLLSPALFLPEKGR